MKILTAAQMRETDRLTTERYGIPSDQLMENAGAAFANYLATAYPNLNTYNVLILCGKGNNGGDGLVVARRLHERGLSPRVVLFAEPTAMRGDAAANLKRWQQGKGSAELHVVTSKAEWEVARGVLAEADLIVDALLGTGLTGPVEGLLAQVIEDVNAVSNSAPGKCKLERRRPRVVSVDMPSGLASDTADFGGPIITADVTVTLTAPKLGQMVSPHADRVGKLIVREIGTPPELLDDDPSLKLHWLEPGEFRHLPLVRRRDSNKGTFGHALIVAGSLGKSGAAILSGRAALRVGAGLATVATPLDVLPIVAAGMPELMTAPLLATETGSVSMGNFDYGRFAAIVHGKSVLAIGPGLSTDTQAQQFIRTAVLETDLPIILDADGLNAFAGQSDQLNERKTTSLAITPHPGEMGRLLGSTAADVQARRLDVALETAARWHAHVILKGYHTILALPDGRAFVNITGNPGMATGGTGDVLTGMLAGLTAEFGTGHWERVLGLGIYLHGLAGDLAASRVGEAPLVASDLIESLQQHSRSFCRSAAMPDTDEFVSHSPEETIAFGRELARRLAPPRLVLLSGDLGSGKTTLSKGIISGLGAASEEDVTSPTFTLVHVFHNQVVQSHAKVYHVDLYRVEQFRDLETLGIEDLLSEPAIIVIEWAERFSLMSDWPRLLVQLEHLEGDARRITISEARPPDPESALETPVTEQSSHPFVPASDCVPASY